MLPETKSLLLREMNPEDYDALLLLLGDPETMRRYPSVRRHGSAKDRNRGDRGSRHSPQALLWPTVRIHFAVTGCG